LLLKDGFERGTQYGCVVSFSTDLHEESRGAFQTPPSTSAPCLDGNSLTCCNNFNATPMGVIIYA